MQKPGFESGVVAPMQLHQKQLHTQRCLAKGFDVVFMFAAYTLMEHSPITRMMMSYHHMYHYGPS